VLTELSDGGRRYQDLDDALDGVSHKVLTDMLRRAERDGLVVRNLDPGRVESATSLNSAGPSPSLWPSWSDGLTATGNESTKPGSNGRCATSNSGRCSVPATEPKAHLPCLVQRPSRRPQDGSTWVNPSAAFVLKPTLCPGGP
jgi:hypothetical protein